MARHTTHRFAFGNYRLNILKRYPGCFYGSLLELSYDAYKVALHVHVSMVLALYEAFAIRRSGNCENHASYSEFQCSISRKIYSIIQWCLAVPVVEKPACIMRYTHPITAVPHYMCLKKVSVYCTLSAKRKQVDSLISKKQVLQILYLKRCVYKTT